LARQLNRHSWAIDVREPKNDCINEAQAREQLMILGGRAFMYAIEIDRNDWMVFVDGKVPRCAVNLPRARIHNPPAGSGTAAGLQKPQLRQCIDAQIPLWKEHGMNMANLSSEIENDVCLAQRAFHFLITNIERIDINLAADRIKIEGIRSAASHGGIHDHDPGSGSR